MKLVVLTLFFCSSAECPSPAATALRRRRQRAAYRPGHHVHVREIEATPSDYATPKVHRRECNFTSVHMGLVIITLLLCSSAECFSSDAAASRRRKQRPKHQPEHHDQVRATHSLRATKSYASAF